jgi:hypothetical protein
VFSRQHVTFKPHLLVFGLDNFEPCKTKVIQTLKTATTRMLPYIVVRQTQIVIVSISLWRWYINITIAFLDIIHRPLFYLKHDVSETVFCFLLEVVPNQMSPIERSSHCLRRQPIWLGSTWSRRKNPVF